MIKTINEETYKEMMHHTAKPVLALFGGTWCTPCKICKKTLEDNIDSFNDIVDIWYVDVEEVPSLSTRYNITSVPYLVVIDNKFNALGQIGNYADYKKILDEVLALVL